MVNGDNVFETLRRREERKEIFQQVVDAGEDRPSFFIGDLDEVARNVAHFKELLPRAKPYFDVSLNDTDYVLKALSELGINFSCLNKFEINKVVNATAGDEAFGQREDVLLDGTCKVASHLRHANAKGVDLLVCGSVQEMGKIRGAAPNSRLLLKLDVGAEYIQAHWKNLFGEAASLGLTVVGLSMEGLANTGSTARLHVERNRAKAAALARLVFDLGLDSGQDCMTLIDVGKIGNGTSLDSELCDFLEGDLLRQFETFAGKEVELMCHPGEFLLSSAVGMAVKVIEKRVVPRGDSKHCSYVVGESIFESFGGLMYGTERGAFKDVESLFDNFDDDVERSGIVTSCDIFGETGDESDIIAEGVLMNEVKVGDWLLFPNMGCYAMNCSFERPVGNSFPINVARRAGITGRNFWYYVKSGSDECVAPPLVSTLSENSSPEDEYGGSMMSVSDDSIAGSVRLSGSEDYEEDSAAWFRAFDDDSFGNEDWCR